MLWQGAKWRILKNFNVQNEECHNYEFATYFKDRRIETCHKTMLNNLENIFIEKE